MTDGLDLKPITLPASLKEEKRVKFSNRISIAHKETLKRLAYWQRLSEQDLLHEALDAFFKQQPAADRRPIPTKRI